MMKKYVAKMPCESIKEAMEWAQDKCGDSKSRALKSGQEGIDNGMGNSFRLVEITFKVLPKIYKGSEPLCSSEATRKESK